MKTKPKTRKGFRRIKGKELKQVLASSTELARHMVAFGYTTIRWKRQPNGSWKNQHGDVMSAKAMKKREERSKGHFFDKRVSVP